MPETGTAHGLRGMDAIQLATPRSECGERIRATSTNLCVATFDRRLLEAAEREGFATLGGPLE